MAALHPSQGVFPLQTGASGAEACPALLTIAIPTYNRAAYVEAQVKKLLPQLCPEARLCIFDNASTDETQTAISAFGSPDIEYYRAEYNCGGERNFFRCFEQCRSEWLWILGDDDPITDDAVEKILEIVRNQDCDYIQMSNPLCVHSREIAVDSIQALFQEVSFSSLLWLSTGLYRVRSFGPFFEYYNKTISTCAPQAAIVLAFLEEKKGKVLVSGLSVIAEMPRLAPWSTLGFIMRVSQLPFYLAQAENRRILARQIWKEHAYWALIVGLREAETPDSVEKWKHVYKTAILNLASYRAPSPWRSAIGDLARADHREAAKRVIRKAILLFLLSRCPFRYFGKLAKYTADVTAPW